MPIFGSFFKPKTTTESIKESFKATVDAASQKVENVKEMGDTVIKIPGRFKSGFWRFFRGYYKRYFYIAVGSVFFYAIGTSIPQAYVTYQLELKKIELERQAKNQIRDFAHYRALPHDEPPNSQNNMINDSNQRAALEASSSQSINK